MEGGCAWRLLILLWLGSPPLAESQTVAKRAVCVLANGRGKGGNFFYVSALRSCSCALLPPLWAGLRFLWLDVLFASPNVPRLSSSVAAGSQDGRACPRGKTEVSTKHVRS